ncbi:MAG: AraC family transcriptional regulator [Pseudomonadales bacterium]|nr:AraC family transcriptional regulator [Pseudomonadales bacterium]
MKAATGQHYRKRLIAVVEYIYHHIDGDLDVNTLADIACMSPYHFHRIYRQMAGETINSTIRRQRLQNAASQLIRSKDALHIIARRVGYGSLEAFSRAFRKEFDQNPSEYRREKSLSAPMQYVATLANETLEVSDMFEVEIINTPSIQLIGYEHAGDYMAIGNAFAKLELYATSKGLLNENSRSIGLYYHDPKTVAEALLRAHACISVEDEAYKVQPDEDNPPEALCIPEGRCATVLFKGSYAELEQPYDWLFGQWLPQSGHEAADFPVFEEYLNDPRTTPPAELLTRIHCLLS